MRRNMLMLLAAALLVVAGCKKDDKNANGEKMTFNAGFDKGGAKTEINDYDLSWKQGDQVSINGSIFTAQNDGPTTTLVGDEVGKVGGLYKAYYPAGIYNGGTPTLPSTQTYSGNDLSGVNPMYAQGSTTDLTFSNICAVLKLQLKLTSMVEKTVNEIRVTAGKPLSGEFEIAEDGGSFKAVMKSNASNAGVTLSCDGVSLTSTPSILYVTLPEGDYSDPNNLQFQVVASDGQVASFKVAASLKANMLYDVVRSLEFKEPVVPSTVTLTAGCEGSVYNMGGSVTVPDGQHMCEFGLVYSATNVEPTVADTKVVAGTATFSGTKTFSADITGLTPNTTYHVRAYAMIEGITYSTAKDIDGGKVPLPLPKSWTDNGGKNPHPFTVGMDGEKPRIVHFSQGNLQYNATGSSATADYGTNVGGTWRFAEHQFDIVGDANKNISQAYEGWIDLLGWGTSGYNHGATCYQPWSTSNTYSQYYAYSTSSYEYNLEDGPDSHKGKADWGKANAISNGSGSSWRTLTKDEWDYLIKSRPGAANLYGLGKVGNCTQGLIILPDDWNPAGLSFTSGLSSWSNVYSYSEWAQMEADGAVFLPTAGYREVTSVKDPDSEPHYWSSSYEQGNAARAWQFGFGTGFITTGGSNRSNGMSVRLVTKD